MNHTRQHHAAEALKGLNDLEWLKNSIDSSMISTTGGLRPEFLPSYQAILDSIRHAVLTLAMHGTNSASTTQDNPPE